MADAVAISSTLSRQRESRVGGSSQTLAIAEGGMDRREKNKRRKLTLFPRVASKSLQLWWNIWPTFLMGRPAAASMCPTCVPRWDSSSHPWQCSHRTRFHELHIFISRRFPFLPLASVFLCSTLLQNSPAIVAASRPE